MEKFRNSTSTVITNKVKETTTVENLYHAEIYLPTNLVKSANDLTQGNVRISFHLKEHIANNDKKHEYDEKSILSVANFIKNHYQRPFEVASVDGVTATKACFRTPLDKENDITLVFRKNIIVTAWINKHNDVHRTLDRTKYVSK